MPVATLAASNGRGDPNGQVEPESAEHDTSSAFGYISTLLFQSDADIERICTEWSVPRTGEPTLSRADARRAWNLRCRLAPDVARRFDGQAVQARRQLTLLYDDVLTAADEHDARGSGERHAPGNETAVETLRSEPA